MSIPPLATLRRACSRKGKRYRDPKRVDCVRIVHFMRNVLAHAGKGHRRIVSAWIDTAFAEADAPRAREQWRSVADQLRPWVPRLATLMDSAEDDVLAFMSYPKEHRAKIHSNNPLERLNGEIKRRTDTVGIFPNEAAATPPTMLPKRGWLASLTLARSDATSATWHRTAWHAEHDLNLVMIDLDAAGESSDDLALTMPVELIQPATDPAGELLQASNDKMQAAIGLVRRSSIVTFGLQASEPLLEPTQARLELVGIDDLFGMAVNQPVHAPPQARDLPIKRVHIPACLAVPSRYCAPFVFGCDPDRVGQHRVHLLPYCLLQLVAAHGSVVAKRLATKLASICAGTAVVAVVRQIAATNRAARHLAVERIATPAAYDEALQQPSRPAAPIALTSSVLIQLELGCFEHLLVDDCRHWDRDPLLPGHGGG